MASTIDAPSFGFSFIERKTYYSNVTKPIDDQESSVLRRSGNYKPPRCVSLLSKQATRRTHTRTIHNSVRNSILMASTIDAPSSGFSFIERRTYYSNVTKPMDDHESAVLRRSGNYKPPRWENDYIQSLCSNYVGDTYLKRVATLKEDVKILLDKLEDSLDGLELIDDLQRLGVSYHFEEEIKRILERIHINKEDKWSKEEDFLATALKFRLLRQYNYDVPQVFLCIRQELAE
ncbi:lysase [Sarracenia purpurea var. burkii]